VDKDGFIYARLGLTVMDTRDEIGGTLDALERTSLDFYASLRTIYRQRRADEIKNRPTTQKLTAPSVSMAAKDDEIETKPAIK
jgi:phospholipid-binding lipoprotein MlaA